MPYGNIDLRVMEDFRAMAGTLRGVNRGGGALTAFTSSAKYRAGIIQR